MEKSNRKMTLRKMINTLKNKGITHFEFKGRVDDAVKRVLNKL
jgi:molecular chaperone GrpE (heat shock protein)